MKTTEAFRCISIHSINLVSLPRTLHITVINFMTHNA